VFGVNVSGNTSLNGGFALETGLGYDFGTVRGELTHLYDNASLNTLSVTALGTSGTASISNGNVNTNSVLASAYVDIPTGSRWVPYLGGGLGYTNIGWGAFSARANNVTVGFNSGSQGYGPSGPKRLRTTGRSFWPHPPWGNCDAAWS